MASRLFRSRWSCLVVVLPAGSSRIARSARFTSVVSTRGESALERVCSLVLLGDLVSFYLAVLAGVDPTPVVALVELKQALAERE